MSIDSDRIQAEQAKPNSDILSVGQSVSWSELSQNSISEYRISEKFPWSMPPDHLDIRLCFTQCHLQWDCLKA